MSERHKDKEVYPGGITPVERWQIMRYEGWDPWDNHEEKNPPYNVYLCAPLQPTSKKPAFIHILEATYCAAQINGARYKGRLIDTFIPHTEILPRFNELRIPEHRIPAIGINTIILSETCDALVRVGRRISQGMRGEIALAQQKGLPTFTFGRFKRLLTDLPSSEEFNNTFYEIMRSLPRQFFTKEFMLSKANVLRVSK